MYGCCPAFSTSAHNKSLSESVCPFAFQWCGYFIVFIFPIYVKRKEIERLVSFPTNLGKIQRAFHTILCPTFNKYMLLDFRKDPKDIPHNLMPYILQVHVGILPELSVQVWAFFLQWKSRILDSLFASIVSYKMET